MQPLLLEEPPRRAANEAGKLNSIRRFRVTVPLLAVLSAPASAAAADLYVSPTGSDSAAGTEAAPLASLAKAQEVAQPGDTVFIRAGTYAFSAGTTTCKSGTDTISGVVLSKSGTAGKPIRYFAYPGEKPVLDFDGIRDSCRIKGILVSADYVHVKGLELKGVRQNNDLNHESWGLWNQGSHNVFELLDVHHIMGAGIFIQRGGDNLVLNCDAHHNLDEHTSNGAGESADGFGCHVDAANTGNVFRGCRAWWNADDGYDFINADAPCTVEHSWAWLNGYKPGTMEAIGNGNGIKAGGYGADPADFPDEPAEHVVRFCLAFANRAAGFYANHHPSSLLFYNNTSYGNHPDFNMLGMDDAGGSITVGKYRNNIALAGTLFSNRMAADEVSNSWTLGGLMVSDGDFQSVAMTGMDAPRQADGSLPLLQNFRLAEGSDLIDKGVDLGLPFAGDAPDLGAFERGLEQRPGAAGSGGAGVAGAGAGGSSGGSGNVAGNPSAAGGSGGAPASAGTSGRPPANGGAPLGAGGGGAPSSSGGSPLGLPSSEPGDEGCGCRSSAAPSTLNGLPLVLFWLSRLRRRSSYDKRVASK